MHPIFDNLTYLMGGAKENDDNGKSVRNKVEKLLTDNVVELEALSYIRGRSIPRQYIVVDEAQNLTPHEVKTIISRAGEGTKIVLTGDPYQIDNPYLDARSNGLAYSVERLKDHRIHGHVTLMKSERSTLAGIAKISLEGRVMRQYVIDQLSREERANIESYLKRTLKPGSMEGLYWIEVPQDLLSGDQRVHKDCGPFFFAVELKTESACFELLIRGHSSLHCSCIAYATADQRDFVLRFVDKMLKEEQIQA